jgi:hypothetical protein
MAVERMRRQAVGLASASATFRTSACEERRIDSASGSAIAAAKHVMARVRHILKGPLMKASPGYPFLHLPSNPLSC